jgi:hypothetical protein
LVGEHEFSAQLLPLSFTVETFSTTPGPVNIKGNNGPPFCGMPPLPALAPWARQLPALQ